MFVLKLSGIQIIVSIIIDIMSAKILFVPQNTKLHIKMFSLLIPTKLSPFHLCDRKKITLNSSLLGISGLYIDSWVFSVVLPEYLSLCWAVDFFALKGDSER